jgi:hypothetical protein
MTMAGQRLAVTRVDGTVVAIPPELADPETFIDLYGVVRQQKLLHLLAADPETDLLVGADWFHLGQPALELFGTADAERHLRHPRSGNYVCAYPPSVSPTVAKVEINRPKANAWETFRLAPLNPHEVPPAIVEVATLLGTAADEPDAPAAVIRQARERAQIMADPAQLFMQFESAGRTCEFGMLQRHYGLEPLGLFRWAGSDYNRILLALARDFDGFGEPANTTLEVRPDEYFIHDTRYAINSHTWVKPSEVEPERMRTMVATRQHFLLRKFREDVASAEKILVRIESHPQTLGQIRLLHQALRRYGPAWLLHVTKAPSPALVGTVELVDDALLVGYLERLGQLPSSWDIHYESWLTVCRRALAIRANAERRASGTLPSPASGTRLYAGVAGSGAAAPAPESSVASATTTPATMHTAP